MKPKITHFLIFAVFIAASCHPNKPPLAPETIYNDLSLSVITTSFNNKQHTTSVLYGNSAALRAAAADSASHVPGEDYRLVTWHQQANPLWFGSNINNAIKTIERVTTEKSGDGRLHIHYQLTRGSQPDISTNMLTQQNRINYIFSQKATAFP